jgi:hypothetical protein
MRHFLIASLVLALVPAGALAGHFSQTIVSGGGGYGGGVGAGLAPAFDGDTCGVASAAVVQQAVPVQSYTVVQQAVPVMVQRQVVVQRQLVPQQAVVGGYGVGSATGFTNGLVGGGGGGLSVNARRVRINRNSAAALQSFGGGGPVNVNARRFSFRRNR